MQREGGRVLVVDDDAVVVVAVSDLLEDEGYRVFSLGTPIGAIQVIVRENIDVAVIDVNMPEMQGDSVVRLFRTWDRLKDLPVVMLSGAESATLDRLRRELPGIQIVRKAEMHARLVPTIAQALSSARASRARPSSEGSPRAPTHGEQPLRSTKDVDQAYLDDLADGLQLVRTAWNQVLSGDIGRSAQATQILDALHKRSQLLNLEYVAGVLQAARTVVAAVTPDVRPSKRAQRGIEDAITTLLQLHVSRARDLPVAPTFLVRELEVIAGELREAHRHLR